MGETNRSGNTRFYNFKIGKEKDLPMFFRVEKEDDSWVETKSVSGIEGYLKGITTEKYTYEGQEKMSIKISLKDNDSDEMIQISAPMNNAVRGMLNSLAGCTNINLVHFQCSKWGKGDKKYPTIFVENNGEKTHWKFQIDEIPKVEKVSDTVYDDRDANAFFKNVIEIDINPKVSESTSAATSKNYAKVEDAKIVADDLPF